MLVVQSRILYSLIFRGTYIYLCYQKVIDIDSTPRATDGYTSKPEIFTDTIVDGDKIIRVINAIFNFLFAFPNLTS
jgi:hypothetical protein